MNNEKKSAGFAVLTVEGIANNKYNSENDKLFAVRRTLAVRDGYFRSNKLSELLERKRNPQSN